MSDRERDPKAGISPKEQSQPVVGRDVPDESKERHTMPSKSAIKTTAKRAKNPIDVLDNEAVRQPEQQQHSPPHSLIVS